MRNRSLVVFVAAIIVVSLGQSGAQATGGSNDGADSSDVASAPSHERTSHARTAVSADAEFRQIKRPRAHYTTATCLIDFSHVADFTVLEEVEGCGVTVDLGFEMVNRSVPDSWATWGSPPHTETATPHVLRTNGPTTYTLTYSSKSNITGLEAEPSPFAIWDITVTWRNGKGEVKGSITRSLDGEGGARLFAARTRGVKTVTISSGADFAIAQLRVKN